MQDYVPLEKELAAIQKSAQFGDVILIDDVFALDGKHGWPDWRVLNSQLNTIGTTDVAHGIAIVNIK